MTGKAFERTPPPGADPPADHFILTMGTVNSYGPLLLIVDTGSNPDYGSMALLPTDATVEGPWSIADQGTISANQLLIAIDGTFWIPLFDQGEIVQVEPPASAP